MKNDEDECRINMCNDLQVHCLEPKKDQNNLLTKQVKPERLQSVASCSKNDYQHKNDAKCNVLRKCEDTISLQSVRSLCCRICHSSEEVERLISPCLCRGTLAFIHKSCLEHWLNTSGTLYCELCKYQFPIKTCLRYGFWESLLLWYQHPNNKETYQADFLVCLLLTVVTFGIAAISLIGIRLMHTSSRLTVSRLWTQGPLIVFLVIVACAYIVNLFVMLKSQLVPWYRWWQSARQVRLIYIDVRDKVQPRRRITFRKNNRTSNRTVESEICTTEI